MLYDPKWEKPAVKTKVEPSLQGMIEWLETQDPLTTYKYWDHCGRCLVGLYYKSIGLGWYEDSVPFHEQFVPLNEIAHAFTSDDMTFGAALERARVAQKAP